MEPSACQQETAEALQLINREGVAFRGSEISGNISAEHRCSALSPESLAEIASTPMGPAEPAGSCWMGPGRFCFVSWPSGWNRHRHAGAHRKMYGDDGEILDSASALADAAKSNAQPAGRIRDRLESIIHSSRYQESCRTPSLPCGTAGMWFRQDGVYGLLPGTSTISRVLEQRYSVEPTAVVRSTTS